MTTATETEQQIASIRPGGNWTSHAGPTGQLLGLLGECGSGHWISGTWSGTIQTSDDDGATWTLRETGSERMFDVTGN